jgi:hypothetical protein
MRGSMVRVHQVSNFFLEKISRLEQDAVRLAYGLEVKQPCAANRLAGQDGLPPAEEESICSK